MSVSRTRNTTWQALAAIVALGTRETPGAHGSMGALHAGGTTIARSAWVAVVPCSSAWSRFSWRSVLASGTDVAFVAFVAFGTWGALRTSCTLSTNRARSAQKPARARQATGSHRAHTALRSTRAFVALGTSSAFLALLAVCSRKPSWTNGPVLSSGANSSRETSWALGAVNAIFAGRSSVARGTDESGFAGRAGVALRAHVAVSAGVASDSRKTARAIGTVETWQTPRALQHKVTVSLNVYGYAAITCTPLTPSCPA